MVSLARKYAPTDQTATSLAEYIADKCMELEPESSCDDRNSMCPKIQQDAFIAKRELTREFAYKFVVMFRRQGASSQQKRSASGNCRATLELHGYLSRAQFQCGFDDYSSEMMDSAKACFDQVGLAGSKARLKQGMERFDNEEKKKGHAAQCDLIRNKYRDVVR